MKNLLFMIVILGLGSCTQTIKEKVKVSDLKDSITVLPAVIEPQIDNNREIISEIKGFKSAMTTKNKTEILSFFDSIGRYCC